MKSVNVKAVLILLLGTTVFCVGVYFLHGYQVQRNAGGLYERAVTLEKEGKKEQATVLLEQYLGLIPSDNEALGRYSLLLEEQAKTPRALMDAYVVLDQAVLRDGTRQDIRRKAAKTGVKLERYEEANQHLQILLKASPDDVELLHLSGRCEAGLRRYDKAGALFARASRAGPTTPAVALESALLLRERFKSPQMADIIIDQLAAQYPRSRPVRLQAAGYFVNYGQLDKAWTHLRSGLDEPESPSDELLLLAGEVALTRGQAEDARQLFGQGCQLFPRDARMSRGLAKVEIRQGKLPQALVHLQPSLLALPKEPEELWSLANLLIDAGAVDQARGVALQFAKKGSSANASFLEARFLVHKGSWGEAGRLLEKVRGDVKLSPNLVKNANFLLAECYEHLLDPDQRLDSLRRAADLDPSWLPARRGLALALAELGKLDLAIAELRKLPAQSPETRRDLARMLVDRNRRLPAAQRDWTEVNRVLSEERDSHSSLLHAEALAWQGKLEEARKLAEAERDRRPDQIAPWLLLIAIAETKGPEVVLGLIDEAEGRVGKRVEWPLLRARSWLKADAATARQQLPKLAAELDHFKGKDRNRLLAGLAEAHAVAGDQANAGRLWSELAELDPDHLGAWLALFNRALETKAEAEARRSLKQIRRLEGTEGPQTAWAEAALRVLNAGVNDKQALKEARAYLTKAATLRPSWARVPFLEAMIFDLEGNKTQALEKYKAALDRGEGRLTVVRRVLELMYEQRRFAEANALLRNLPEHAAATPELGRVASQLTLATSGRDGPNAPAGRRAALELARKAVAADSKDHRDHMWLGQIAALAEQPKDAAQAFRRACELNGQAPETWIALIIHLVRTDPKETDAVVEQAKKQLPAAQLPVVLGYYHEALGEIQKAEEQHEAAVAARPDDAALLRGAAAFYFRTGQLAKAEKSFRRLLQPKTGESENAHASTRRELALVLAFQGGYPQFREALTLLEANAKREPASQDDRRVKALVLATQPAHRRESINLFESLSGQPSVISPAGQFWLAQLYLQDGNWPKARANFAWVLSEHGTNPYFVGGFVRALLLQGQNEEAEVWADKLATIAPKAFDTIALRARARKANGKAKESATLLLAYSKEKEARLDLTASLLDQLGFGDEAEAVYRNLVATSRQPESALMLARHLAAKRLPEALALCEKAWDTCPPGAVAMACGTVLREGKADKDQYQRVERWLSEALAKNPKDALVPLVYGELLDMRGRHGEAVTLYRRVIALSPDNVVALNNLAYLLVMKGEESAEALQLAQRALDVAGPLPELLDTRALAYLKAGQADRALKDLNQAIALAPTPTMYLHLAQAQRLANNRVAAGQAIRKARDMGLNENGTPPLEQPTFKTLSAEFPG